MKKLLPSLAVLFLGPVACLAPTFVPKRPDPTIEERITQEALRAGVRPGLALYVARRESGMNPLAVHRNRNGSFDRGLFQLNDRTVQLLHIADVFDVQQNVIGGVGVLGMGLDKCHSEAGALNYFAHGRCLTR